MLIVYCLGVLWLWSKARHGNKDGSLKDNKQNEGFCDEEMVR